MLAKNDTPEFLPTFTVKRNTRFTKLNEQIEIRNVYYRLGDSEAFMYANKNALPGGNRIIDTLPKMVLSDQGFVPVSYDRLDQSIRYELFESRMYDMTCRKDIRRMLDTGDLTMVYSENVKIPVFVPYILQGEGQSARAIINAGDYLLLDKVGNFQINDQRNYAALMAAIIGGALGRKTVVNNRPLPADIGDCVVLTYAGMLAKCINASIAMDPVTEDKIRYLAAEFALIQMYGTELGQKMFFDRFAKTYFPRLSKMVTDAVDAQFKTDNFDKLSRFIEGLKEVAPSTRGLTLYGIYDRWNRMFKEASTLAIDHMGYILYVLCMVIFRSPLINVTVLKPITDTATAPVTRHGDATLYKRIQQYLED